MNTAHVQTCRQVPGPDRPAARRGHPASGRARPDRAATQPVRLLLAASCARRVRPARQSTPTDRDSVGVMSSAPSGYADKRVVFDLLEDMRQAWERVLNDYARTHGGSSPRRTPRSAGRNSNFFARNSCVTRTKGLASRAGKCLEWTSSWPLTSSIGQRARIRNGATSDAT